MIYDAFITEEYEDKGGAKKPRFHQVGVAFDAKNGEGMDVIIPPGLSVTGRISIRRRKVREAGEAKLDDDEVPY